MAVAIAGLTGRRLGEVLARGTFGVTDHPYLLHFEGQQKHERSGYDIITLIPAPTLLIKIEEFRALPEIKGLMRLQGEDLTQAINKFDVQVNRECHKYLSRDGLVPPLENRKRVTIHNLRSLWGAIAVWMFCPPHHHEYAFIQHYLGHVLDSSATGHYFRYRLVDNMGTVLQEQGTMLKQVPELPLLANEVQDMGAELMVEAEHITPQQPSGTIASPETTEETGPIEDSVPVSGPQPSPVLGEIPAQLEQLRAELRAEWQEQLTALQQDLLAQLAKSNPPAESDGVLWLVERVAALEDGNQALVNKNQALAQERDALKQKVAQGHYEENRIQTLEIEKQALATQLNEAQAKLDGFRRLLLGNDEEAETAHEDPVQAETTAIDQPSPEKRGKPGRKPGKAMERAQNIFDALRAWNAQHPEETVAISPGLLETQFKVHRQAAKQFCEDRQHEISDHHAEIGVETAMFHNRGKNLEAFKAFVQAFH